MKTIQDLFKSSSIALLLTLLIFPSPLHAQIAAAPIPFIKTQWFDSSGNPLSAGCLYQYSSGTTNHKVTYTTSAGSGGASNPQPIILDAAGRTTGVWLGSGSYRFDLYAAGVGTCSTITGTLVWSIDNVPGFGPAGGGSAIGGSGSAGQCAYFTAATTIAGDAGCAYDSVTDSLTLAGALSLGTTLGVTGNFAINTTMFTVTASNGNTAAAGTLTATGGFYTGAGRIGTTTAAYGAGTAYSLTNTAAAIDFGTTDPAIVIPAVGTYLVCGQVNLAYTGATVAAETATIKVRRTNNTAADLSAVVVLDLPVATTLTHTYGVFQIPCFTYTTAATDDAVTIFANVSAALGAGTINATAIGTSITAQRIY